MATHIQGGDLADAGIAGESTDPPVRRHRRLSSGIEIALLADSDGRHLFVVLVRAMIVLLPAGLRHLAAHVDVQGIVSTGFKYEVETRLLELELVPAVAFVEQETVQHRPGSDRIALLRTRFPVREERPRRAT